MSSSRDPGASLAQEGGRVGALADPVVAQRSAAELGIVEEGVDASRPRGDVQVGLVVMPVAWRSSVGATPAGGLVAHVDRDVEMLRPETDRGDVVVGAGLGAELLERPAGEGE